MILQYHEVFGQWYVPDVRAYVPHERGYFIVRTNRLGMRSSADHSEPRGARMRILAFGDSFTAGWGVHNEERFSDQLEELWEGLEVLNFGLDGSGLDQQLLVFEHLGSRFEADAILCCPLVENIRRVTARYWPMMDRVSGEAILVPKPYATLEAGRLVMRHLPVPRERFALGELPESLRPPYDPPSAWRRRVSRWLEPIKPPVMRLLGHQPYPQYDTPDHPAWRLTAALLERFIELAGPRPVVLAPLPVFYYSEGLSPPTYRERFREFAAGHPTARFLDLLPFFLALPPAERRRCRYAEDVHYTPFGHAVVARALRQELARLIPADAAMAVA
jgi:carbamoyltransferase